MTRTLLPVLRPFDWPHASLAWCRPLLAATGAGIPWISFGYDTPQRIETIVREHLAAEGATEAQLEATAIRNLEARPVAWTPQAGPGGRPSAFTAHGEYAPEAILSRTLMKYAQDALGTDALAVGIPARAVIVLQNAHDVAGLPNLVAWCARTHDTARPGTALARAPFLVRDGSVAAVISGIAAGQTHEAAAREVVTGGLPPLRGGEVLRLVDYVPRTQSVELSCAARPDEGVPRDEIALACWFARAGRLADGRPIAGARVTFLYEGTAHRIGPELRAGGVAVEFLGADGQTRRLP